MNQFENGLINPEPDLHAECRADAAELRSLLKELHAMVWGECPSLLDEDSGGSSHLDMRINDALSKADSHE